jgi:hypothetical protein
MRLVSLPSAQAIRCPPARACTLAENSRLSYIRFDPTVWSVGFRADADLFLLPLWQHEDESQ